MRQRPGVSEPLLLSIAAGLVLMLIVAGIFFAKHLEHQRQDAIRAATNRLGLGFSPGRNHELAHRHEDLRGLHEGENRYAFDVIEGSHRGRRLMAFDFHYETTSTNSQGNRTTSHYYHHILLLDLEREFPDLLTVPENVFSKIAQAFGYDDIDFESHEFSRRFCVRSSDKKYAYDFCNALMIDFLLDHPDLHLETKGSVLAIVFEDKMETSLIETQLDLICEIRNLMPAYLYETA